MLEFNYDKTHIVIIHLTRGHRHALPEHIIKCHQNHTYNQVSQKSHARKLGMTFDRNMVVEQQVANIHGIVYCHLRSFGRTLVVNLKITRDTLYTPAAIASLIDYRRLQSVN